MIVDLQRQQAYLGFPKKIQTAESQSLPCFKVFHKLFLKLFLKQKDILLASSCYESVTVIEKANVTFQLIESSAIETQELKLKFLKQ